MNTWLSQPRMLLLAVAATLATALGAQPAHAGILVNTESAKNCTTQDLSQPFTRSAYSLR